MNLEQTLAERGTRYGDFADHARIAQAIKTAMQSEAGCAGWGKLSDHQKQALEVIADKIARILNGDPNYIDNFRDIEGYARLVRNILEETPGATDVKHVYFCPAEEAGPACQAPR